MSPTAVVSVALLLAACVALIAIPQWVVARHITVCLRDLCAIAEEAATAAVMNRRPPAQLVTSINWPPPGPGVGVQELRPGFDACGFLLCALLYHLPGGAGAKSWRRTRTRMHSTFVGSPRGRQASVFSGEDPWSWTSSPRPGLASSLSNDAGFSPLSARLGRLLDEDADNATPRHSVVTVEPPPAAREVTAAHDPRRPSCSSGVTPPRQDSEAPAADNGGTPRSSSSSSAKSSTSSQDKQGQPLGGLAAVMAAKKILMSNRSQIARAGRRAGLPPPLTLRRQTVECVAVARGFADYATAAGAHAAGVLHQKWLDAALQSAKGASGVLERFVGDETHMNFGGVQSCSNTGSKAARALLALRKQVGALSGDEELAELTPPQSTIPAAYAGACQGPALCGYLGAGVLRAPAVIGRVAVAAKALAALAEQTGFDVLVDRRVADEAQATVTAVPVDVIRVGRWGRSQEVCHLLGTRGDSEKSGEWLYLINSGQGANPYLAAWDRLRQGEVTGAAKELLNYHQATGSHVARQVAARLLRYEEEVRRHTGKASTEYCRCVETHAVTPVPLLRPLDPREAPLRDGIMLACPVRGDDEQAGALPRHRRQSIDSRRRSSPPMAYMQGPTPALPGLSPAMPSMAPNRSPKAAARLLAASAAPGVVPDSFSSATVLGRSPAVPGISPAGQPIAPNRSPKAAPMPSRASTPASAAPPPPPQPPPPPPPALSPPPRRKPEMAS
eukprot:TRINITY_DN7396_c1_g1_i1.p1 TRINITY_DN7396_c1_g1~~TRINITY_DN7396_c1_g1_i1.p1  ORF type:complete len:834 (+),score=226.58 TRINITY_DN7396_c1_g1_i1:315-2504(+)